MTFDKADECIVRTAYSRSALRDRIQHRLDVGRRTSDDTQYFTRRRLLLQRLLEFLEQPHVLDGDHRLIGEGFENFDLRIREWSNFRATNRNCADSNPAAE